MQYTITVEIDCPRDRVVALIQDDENLPHWQAGFVGAEPISGPPGAVGSQTKLSYTMGKRSLDMVETIEQADWPDTWVATFAAGGVWNRQVNHFHETESGTRWESINEFRFSKWPMRVMSWVMPGAFRKQSAKYMDDFKAFAETGASVRPGTA